MADSSVSDYLDRLMAILLVLVGLTAGRQSHKILVEVNSLIIRIFTSVVMVLPIYFGRFQVRYIVNHVANACKE